MAFADIPAPKPAVDLLQLSLERGRLGHAYLFAGNRLEDLEKIARDLVKTLNCLDPEKPPGSALPIDCCDQCINCRKVDNGNHADVMWLRPESKSRRIVVDQVRNLIRRVNLKPTEAEYKTSIVVAADRLKTEAANAFLKTLEEPPPRSVIILLTTEPQRLLETILSRCLRLTFGNVGELNLTDSQLSWIESFSELAATQKDGLLPRYKLLGNLLAGLAALREQTSDRLEAASPLEQYEDVETGLKDQWEEELKAAIEAEYRRQRGDLLTALQWWLRDVWIRAQGIGEELLALPRFSSASAVVGKRIRPDEAVENLRVIEQTQRILHTNVQESLALEVGLLKLKL